MNVSLLKILLAFQVHKDKIHRLVIVQSCHSSLKMVPEEGLMKVRHIGGTEVFDLRLQYHLPSYHFLEWQRGEFHVELGYHPTC